MKTIYSIYERLHNVYNGLLSGMEDTLSAGDATAKDIYNSLKEKLIRIVVASSNMTDREAIIFRNLLNDMIQQYGYKALCYFPKTLQSSLIVASDRKLKSKDFYKFPANTKEYNFRCSMEYMYIESASQYAFDKETIEKINNNKGSFYQINNKVRAIRLGNAIIYQYGDILYIIVNNVHRIVLRITDNLVANYIDLN